ncbi:unnamed protein product [Rotaria sordida]|uniref:Decapping nuclease n=1 Tax=Rotaria sordida TaxID=392033 RepID=A0A819IL53_9BILA|nr:unnamed protein product [Rotaria sordida]CAF1305053.1 unnamed protein product [Rotaria sordida]CAF3913675.1 unnamed protein product [Rotaria sordida]CAF3983016.1 unnamed protein product [Rotaria sordida]
MAPERRSFCYYGHKFEEYVTKNDTSTEPLNLSQQFAGVFQVTIGSYRLLCSAEMDRAVEKSSSITEHIELKFNIRVRMKGIRTIVIGLRDNNGIVNSLVPLNITDIEKATCTWSRQSFFNFFLLFAEFLQQHVTNEYSHTHKDVVLFHFLPSSQTISMTKSSDSKYHFLPDWFFNQFI